MAAAYIESAWCGGADPVRHERRGSAGLHLRRRHRLAGGRMIVIYIGGHHTGAAAANATAQGSLPGLHQCSERFTQWLRQAASAWPTRRTATLACRSHGRRSWRDSRTP